MPLRTHFQTSIYYKVYFRNLFYRVYLNTSYKVTIDYNMIVRSVQLKNYSPLPLLQNNNKKDYLKMIHIFFGFDIQILWTRKG